MLNKLITELEMIYHLSKRPLVLGFIGVVIFHFLKGLSPPPPNFISKRSKTKLTQRWIKCAEYQTRASISSDIILP